MAEDTRVTDYRAAWKTAYDALQILKPYLEIINTVADRLRGEGWKTVQVGPFQNAVTLSGWPTGEDLYDAISNFQQAYRKARELYKDAKPLDPVLSDPATLIGGAAAPADTSPTLVRNKDPRDKFKGF
jgi:hypothetical protein